MKCFNRFRAKDPVLATIISMGMIMSAQAIAGAQSNDWEEVGPAALSAQQQLMSAPPQIGANVSGQVGYRPPVERPVVATANTEIQNEYTVQAGDTLPKIAMKIYGDPNRWQDLMVLNNIDNGNRIYVGQKLITVASNNIIAEEAPVAEHEIAEMPEESESADASFYGVGSDGTYTVKKGDTLGKIAKQLLGSTSKWQKIAKANPSIDPNRLQVGDVLVIPGAKKASSPAISAQPIGVSHVEQRAISAQPWQMAAANSQPVNNMGYNNYGYAQSEPAIVSDPSFDPNAAGIVAPPPPPMAYSNFNAPQAPVPPAPPAYQPNNVPVYSSDNFAPPPAPPAGCDCDTIPGAVAPVQTTVNHVISDQPVATHKYELYREEKYRLPDELKATDFDPYFTNVNGYRGLFNTESALIPYLPTWNIGFSYKHDNLKFFNGEKDIVDGSANKYMMNLNYTGHKFFAGITVPYQTWEEGINGGKKAELSGMHDTSVKVGYQVWKNFEGTHAVTLHLEGKIAGGNYHSPIVNQYGLSDGRKSKEGAAPRFTANGPAGAYEGSWVEFGGAYSGILNDKWASHLNLAFANNSKDDITKIEVRAGTDYRVNRNFALVGELSAENYQAPTDVYGGNGMNADLTLGFMVFNDEWQANLGFPINIKHEWGTESDFSVIAGINHRWD